MGALCLFTRKGPDMTLDRRAMYEPGNITTIKHVDAELWRWLRKYGATQGQYAGETVNALIDAFRRETGSSELSGFPFSPTTQNRGSAHMHRLLSIRGVDREGWQWLRARAGQEDLTIGQLLNALIVWQRRRLGASGETRATRKRWEKVCDQCGAAFQSNNKYAELCSSRCRTARHRQRRKSSSA